MPKYEDYDELLQNIKNNFIIYTQQSILENYYTNMFDMWLEIDAGTGFGQHLIHLFETSFPGYITQEIRNELYIAGKHIVFGIQSLMSYNKKVTIKGILSFSKNYIDIQFNDFGNWCDGISSALYEESSEYEREFGKKENK